MKKILFTFLLLEIMLASFAQQLDMKNPATGFIENKGQITDQHFLPNQQVKYLLNSNGLNVQLKANSFSYDTYIQNKDGNLEFHRVDIELFNANSSPEILPLKPSTDYLNYYTAGTPESGVLNVKHYAEVIYKNIYNGIDLHFKANISAEKPVEYDFIVHPGADASQIKLNYIGAFDKKIENGKIILKLAHGSLSETIPASYIFENNEVVAVNYKNQNGCFAFSVANYDKSKTLVIDPNPDRDWGTYYGTTSVTDDFRDITTDATANIYVTGSTSSTTAIATTGAHQTTLSGATEAMVVKFNTNGVRQWGTYYGGTGSEEGEGIALDASANVYVVGRTSSTTNISTAGAYQTALSGGTGYDAFFVKFNTSGVRQFGTYFGGTANETVTCIAVSGTSVYFGGNAQSTSGIATTGAYLTTLTGGAYLAKFNTTGAIQWATYYQAKNVFAVTVDGGGNPIFGGQVDNTVTGTATAGAHQTSYGGGANDGFVAKFTSAGLRTWATYYGGTGDDNVRAIKTNSTNNVIFGGITASSTGIGANVAAVSYYGGTDGYIANLNSTGVLQWGMYVGTSASDNIYDIEIPSDNSIYYSGTTTGSIGYSGAYQTTIQGGTDLFMGKIDPLIIANYGASYNPILWSTNYGSSVQESHGGIALSGTALDRKIYICGSSNSPSVMASTGAHQTANTAGYDGILARFTECGTPGRPGTIVAPGAPYCAGATYTFSVPAAYNATTYNWVLPSGWSGTSTTNSITVTAGSIGGTISVQGVNSCGSGAYSSLTGITITALPTFNPVVSGTSPVCIGASQTYTCTTVSGATSYTWQLPAGWSGSSSTNSINATIGGSTGSFPIHVAGTNACGNGPFSTVGTGSLNVTVSTVPSQPSAISGNANPCQGTSVTYSVTSMGAGITYNWTLPSGWTGSSTSNSIGVTVGTGSGTISVSASNFCGAGTPQTLAVTPVNAAPATPGPISGPTTACQGSTQIYSVTPVAGATNYGWTLPGGWTGSSTSNTITVTVGLGAGTITVYTANACGSSSGVSTISVTGLTTPATPSVITGNTFVCAGTSQTYSVTNVAGNTYNWTLPSGWTGSSTSNSITVTPNGTSGTISVTATNACGTSPARTLSVTASATPAQPTALVAPNPVCQGSSQTYQTNNDFSATTYTWTLPSGWSGSSTIGVINTTVGASSGNITVTAGNSCGTSSPLIIPITVNAIPATPGTISGNTSVCSGSSQTYNVTNVAGVTYNWTMPSGWTGSSTSNSITATAGATSGNITVTATNSCGTSSAQTLAVTVNTTPAQPSVITGNVTVCQGSSQTYSVTNVAGVTYNWTMPSGWIGSSTSNSITATAGATSGNITVTATNSCGTSSAQTLAVTVNTAPAQPSVITGNATVCQGSSQTYSVTNVAGVTYNWTMPSGWTGSSTSSSITATAGATSGNISVTATNSCGTSIARTFAVTVNTIPATPGAITGNTAVCSGTSQTYSITPVSGATSYTWTMPSGWTGSSSSNSITATASSTSGNITVAATNSCGTSSAQTLAVTVNIIPAQPSVISGSATVCQGSSQTYSVTNVAGVTYNWTMPSGWTGSSTSNSITATAGATSGNITVTATNSCGTSTARTLAVTVNSLPATPGTISGSTNICSGSSNTYSIAAVSGATSYTWTMPSGWTGTSITTSISPTASATGGNITVIANNACGSSSAQTLAVTVNSVPSTPSTITGSVSVCQGTTQSYSVTNVAGVTYTWNATGGTVSGSGNSISITWNTVGPQTITVNASNACGTSSNQTLGVTVNSGTALSQPGTITGNTTVCSGTSQSYSISPVSGATSYTWTLPGGWTGTSTSTTIPTTVGTNGGTISVAANNSCGSSTAQTLTVTVNNIPATPGIISGNTTVCSGTAQTYSIASVSGATSYTWSLPGGWTGSSTTNSIPATAGTASGNITVTASNTCGTSAAQTLAVTTNTIPAQPTPITGSAVVCDGSSNNYSVTAVSGATSYTWTLPGGWIGTSTSTTIPTTATGTSGNITVTANNSCGSSTAQILAVTVNAIPAQPGIITGNTNVCQGANEIYSVSPVVGASAYIWNLPSGWSGVSSAPSINSIAGNSGGVISVSATNVCGTSTPQSVSVTVNNIDNTVLVSGNTITANQSGANYQWLDCANGFSVIAGETNQSFVAASTGSYAVQINFNGCVDTSSCENIIITGIENQMILSGWEIYPNPSTGLFNLFIVTTTDEIITISIKDMLANNVYAETLSGNTVYSKEINIQELAKGIYTITLHTKYGEQTKKLIVQ